MPTPRQGYKLKDGTRVPGVTTILKNLGWNREPLMAWAYKQGKDGLDFRDTSQRAADVGSITHQMVEDSLHEREFDSAPHPPELVEKARPAFSAYQKWARGFQLRIVATEVHLVSEKHRFGGTPDTIGYAFGDELSLFDWKTSAAIYDEYTIQVAAYWNLWTENHPELPTVPGAHLVRFGKDGGFSHNWFTGEMVATAFAIFTHLRSVHDLHLMMRGKAA